MSDERAILGYPARFSSIRLCQLTVACTWLNVHTWSAVSSAVGSGNVGASRPQQCIGAKSTLDHLTDRAAVLLEVAGGIRQPIRAAILIGLAKSATPGTP